MSTELLNKIASADWQALQTLSQHCTACALSAMGRQHVVFSDGGPGPKLVVVGEAPGAVGGYFRAFLLSANPAAPDRHA